MIYFFWGIVYFLQLCSLLYAGYLFVHAYYFRVGLSQKNFIDPEAELPILSIVIAVRNEENTLPVILNCLQQQQYPSGKLEIIVVNDHSTDSTQNAFYLFRTRKNDFAFEIKWFDLPPLHEGKKQALTYGIEHAKGTIIITTDADCTFGPHYIKTIATYFASNPKVVLVSGPLIKECIGTSFFQQVQVLEASGMMALGAAAIQMKKPTLANGANLAFKKEVFTKLGGYQMHAHIASGDDELFMHEVFNQKAGEIVFAFDSNAIVYTQTTPQWLQFKQQRLRWVSKSASYKKRMDYQWANRCVSGYCRHRNFIHFVAI